RTYLWSLLHNDGDNFDFVGSLSGAGGNHDGHIGWTIPMLAGSVGSWVSTYQPDIILLNIGANDIDHGDSAANMTANLSRLLGNIYAAKPNTYVILSTLIPTSHGDPNTWSSYNASIPGVAAAYGGHKIVVLDMSHNLGLSDLADGIHPNMAGYNKMASLWYPVVTTIYKEYTK
ncbi:MAG TPA: SGNH/GDSL hydrolase family protein, partial [Candidatus Saccharimonadales bacterium]|nr:SGNH/GDSL hydrolase family protein [Candidatus Saccharimonadales bacterium]